MRRRTGGGARVRIHGWLLVAVLWLLAPLALARSAPQPLASRLTQAWFVSADTPEPPSRGDARWQPVELPHVWSMAEQQGRGGWYRLAWRDPAARTHTAAPPWSVYLPQVHVNAALWLDGLPLGDGGRLADPMAFHWNHPMLFRLPPAVAAGAEHELLIRVRVAGGFGLLAPVEIGPDAALRARHDLRRFWQAEVHGVLALLLLSIAALSLAIWGQRRQDTQYLWLAVSCIAWAVFAVFLYGREFWIDPLWMQWLAQNGTVWWVTGLAHYVHRLTGGPRRRIERVVVGFSLLFGVAALLLDPLSRVHVYSLGHVFALITVGYLLVCTLRHARRTGAGSAYGLALACAVVLLAGVHDVVLTMPVAWSSMALVRQLQDWRFYLTPFGAPLASVLLAFFLARRFVSTLAQFEGLNAQLERRVEDSRQALDRQYEARRQLERAQAAAEERERIVREMHDGIGGHLMTALRGVERGAFSQDRLTELLQDSLDDLRLIIDASSASTALQPALAAWRSRWDPRLEALGVALSWHVDEAIAQVELAPDVVLQLMRILQEAVINTVKHAQASEVDIDTRLLGAELQLVIRDNGRGALGPGLPTFAPASAGAGQHGLRSMHSRAAAIGARLEWCAAVGGGTQVLLRLGAPALPA